VSEKCIVTSICLIFSKRGISGSGEDYDEATELLQQAGRSTDPIGTSQLQAASGTQSYGGYGNGPSKGPWDQSYTTPGGRKRVVFPWEMGGPVTLGSSKNGNKNIMMWGKLLANEGRST
jgi:hypothetical protein